jgi:hypothetical protein
MELAAILKQVCFRKWKATWSNSQKTISAKINSLGATVPQWAFIF